LEDVAVVRGAMGDAVDVEAQRGSPIGEVEMEASPAEQLQPQQQQLQQQHDSPRKGDKSFGSRGVRITFKDLSYHVPNMKNKKERAYLLKNVSGWFEPNQMAALVRARMMSLTAVHLLAIAVWAV